MKDELNPSKMPEDVIEPSVPQLDADKVALTGRRRAGKDHVAGANGYKIMGFADPMYELAEHYVGSSDKEKPGVLDFIYKVGAWGRGEVSEEYPLTPERRRITNEIRSQDLTSIIYAWDRFGKSDSFWINVLKSRVQNEVGEEDRIAVTNARFPNELDMLLDQGFEHRHVMCAEKTRKDRLGEEEYHGPSDDVDGLPVTEQMAAWFDQAALGKVSTYVDKEMVVENQDIQDQLLGEMEDVVGHKTIVWNDSPENKPPALGGTRDTGGFDDLLGTAGGEINAISRSSLLQSR